MASPGGGKRGRKNQRSKRTVVTLNYPKHWIKPEDLLDFLETPQFTRRWEDLGLNDEEDHVVLQLFIAAEPNAFPVISGTNSIRKMRYSPPGWNVGKSGALRVLFTYFEEFGFVYLLLIYGKNEIDDISDTVKDYLNQLVEEAEEELRQRRTLKIL